jgi:hypothetical protein
MPGVMARLVFGEMANELLLSSTRVIPQAYNQGGDTTQTQGKAAAWPHSRGPNHDGQISFSTYQGFKIFVSCRSNFGRKTNAEPDRRKYGYRN